MGGGLNGRRNEWMDRRMHAWMTTMAGQGNEYLAGRGYRPQHGEKKQVFVYVCVLIWVFVCLYMCVRMLICVFECLYVCLYAYMCVCVLICVFVCLYVCLCVSL